MPLFTEAGVTEHCWRGGRPRRIRAFGGVIDGEVKCRCGQHGVHHKLVSVRDREDQMAPAVVEAIYCYHLVGNILRDCP